MNIKTIFGICAILNLIILVGTVIEDHTIDSGRLSAVLGWSCAYMQISDNK